MSIIRVVARLITWLTPVCLSLVFVSASACATAVPASPSGSLASPSPALQSPTSAVQQTAAAETLTVFAAASLTSAFQIIGRDFEAANPGTSLAFNFAGSQQLAQQIAQGAPADVFASANTAQMNVVIQSGQVISGAARTFARNRLVVIYPQANPAGLAKLQDLARPGLKLILADKSVPVGAYAMDFLAKASKSPDFTPTFSPTVLANVVSYENDVKAVLSKVALGEADAGIVYTTDAASDTSNAVGRLDIPDPLNTLATYPIAAIKGSPNAHLAAKFVDYVLSTAGQAVLAKFGFIT
jgi:molybdate transport system substrate-binding protein